MTCRCLLASPLQPLSVRKLADAADDPVAETLEHALECGQAVIALTVPEREQVLRGLADDEVGETQLAEPRAVLLREHEGRVRDGLV